MKTNDTSQTQELIDKCRALGTILGTLIGLFTVIQVVTQQPTVALAVAFIGALTVSVYFVRKSYVMETVVAWLVAIVIGLVVFVLFPRSVTVVGTVYDASDLPISNEQVTLIDAKGVEHKTKTDKQGRYEFKEVPVANFEVRAKGAKSSVNIANPLIIPEVNIHVPVAPIPIATNTSIPVNTPTQPLLTFTPTATASPTSTPTATPTHTPSPTPRVAWKMNVSDGDRVAQTITLVGEYPVDLTDDILVFVVAPDGRYYPQSMNACEGERTPKVNGKWEMRTGLGGPDNAGEFFQIALAVADSQASQFVINTLRGWCQADKYPGWEKLPQGVMETRRITVRRTADRADKWGPAPTGSNIQLPGNVSITNIAAGDSVPQPLRIEGTYTPEATEDIWVLVYPTNGRWYSQSRNACTGIHTQKASGAWQVLANLGDEKNVGEPFDIVVVLANAKASASFDAKQRQWCEAKNFPGFLTIELPEGIAEKSRIRVYRK